jgi:beta-phosphoglucomutase-like phosphatase (HAD superfamily)
MEKMGGTLEETAVFEDALYAIKTAKAAGFYTVGLYDETSRNDQEAIAGLADCYVREIQSVPTQDCT